MRYLGRSELQSNIQVHRVGTNTKEREYNTVAFMVTIWPEGGERRQKVGVHMSTIGPLPGP